MKANPFELALLTAEPDDEPLTDHERAAIEEAERRRQRLVARPLQRFVRICPSATSISSRYSFVPLRS